VADRIRFYFDEHIPKAVMHGLRRRGIDVVRAQDVGLREANDDGHMEFALREMRVLVTQDADFLQAYKHGRANAGIAYCDQGSRTIGEMIAALVLIYEVLTPEEMAGHVEYL